MLLCRESSGKRANKPQSKAFHVFDITGQSVLVAIPRTIGLAAAKCVEIDYSIGSSQGQKKYGWK